MDVTNELKKLKKKYLVLEKRVEDLEKLLDSIDIMELLISEDDEEELYHILRRQRNN